ncbi:MAG: hypothetical protein ABIG84_08665 [archaeon]
MPFTPFHLGPALLFGMIFFRFVNIPAFIVGSIVVDVEPFFVILFGLSYPLHGFFHSILGGSIAALAVVFVVMKINGTIKKAMKHLWLKQENSSRSVLIGSFLGVYFHIFLDSFLYADIRPFFPLDANPLYGLVLSGSVYSFCVIALVFGIILYGILLIKKSASTIECIIPK